LFAFQVKLMGGLAGIHGGGIFDGAARGKSKQQGEQQAGVFHDEKFFQPPRRSGAARSHDFQFWQIL
jgi:hypothetical protein